MRRRNGNRPLSLFLDQLSAHKMLSVRDEMARLNIEPIFNAVYSPEFNSIEVVFSKAKHFYKKFKL